MMLNTKKYLFTLMLLPFTSLHAELEPYCVQVLSFDTPNKALLDNLVLFLKENPDARVEKIGAYYTVRIGLYEGYSEAKHRLSNVIEEYPGSYIRHCIHNPEVRVDITESFPNLLEEIETSSKNSISHLKPAITKSLDRASSDMEKSSEMEKIKSKNEKSDLDLLIHIYNNKLYKEVLPKLKAYTKENPEEGRGWYYLGRVQFENKLYKDSIDSFSHSLKITPDHTLSALERARAYYYAGQISQAQTDFKKLLKFELPKNVKENIYRFLALIELHQNELKQSESAKSMVHFNAVVGLGYDDNINTASNIESYTIPLYNVVATNDQKKISDSFLQSSFALNYKTSLNNSWAYAVQGSSYVKAYKNNNQRDNLYFNLKNSISYTTDSYKLTIPLSLSRLWYGGDPYLHATTLGLNYGRMLSPNTNLSLETSLKLNHYIKEIDQARDSLGWLLGGGVDYALSDSRLLHFSLGYEVERKESNNNRTDVDNDAHTASFRWTELFGSYIATLGTTQRWTRYQDSDPIFLSKRNDHNSRFSFSLSTYLFEDWLMMLELSHVKNDSNHDPYAYNKMTYGLNLQRGF